MIPAFFSTDLDRTTKFWGALGFTVVWRYEGFMSMQHPTGFVINFGLDPDLVPSKNMTNAYLRFATSTEAVALFEEWVDLLPDGGFIHAPATTFYRMIEWGMTDPDANALRVGGPAEPSR
jgi:catechol 2,3-dioxygenase-like lactoylglutathione lyase family enzyme